jgi:hypothetical protein
VDGHNGYSFCDKPSGDVWILERSGKLRLQNIQGTSKHDQFYCDSRCANASFFFRTIREETRIIKILCHYVSDLGHSPGSSWQIVSTRTHRQKMLRPDLLGFQCLPKRDLCPVGGAQTPRTTSVALNDICSWYNGFKWVLMVCFMRFAYILIWFNGFEWDIACHSEPTDLVYAGVQ